jgi:hypothetical protein
MPVDGPAAHDVHDHQRNLSRHRQAERLDHQREPRSRGRGHGRHAAERGADAHVDRGQLILGLDQAPADLRQMRRQPFLDLRRGRDRVSGAEAHPAAQGTQADSLVTRQQPARSGIRRRQPARRGERVGRDEARIQAGQRAVHQLAALALEQSPQRGSHTAAIEPEQAGSQADGDGVDPCAAVRTRQFRQAHLDSPCAGCDEPRGRLALDGIGDHDAGAIQHDLVGEALRLAPVERDQTSTRSSWQATGLDPEPHQGRRLAATDLRSRGARHQAEVAGIGGRVQQDLAGGHHAGAAAADQRQRAGSQRAVGPFVIHVKPPCRRPPAGPGPRLPGARRDGRRARRPGPMPRA